MSTDSQVQSNFFIYVDCYLWNNGLTPNATDYSNFQSDQFTISQDLNGYFSVQSWVPTSVSQPTETNLQAISPDQLNTFQKYMKAVMLSNNESIVYQVLLDQQNQIRVQQSLTPYTDDQYNYISGLNF